MNEPQDAEAKLLSKINKAVRDKDADAFLAAIESSREQQKWTPKYLREQLSGRPLDDKLELICAAHNAALAAERKESSEALEAHMLNAAKLLKRNKTLVEAIEEMAKSVPLHPRVLAALAKAKEGK
jgi:hypothetical protein